MVMLYQSPCNTYSEVCHNEACYNEGCYNEACYNEFELYLQNERLKHLVQEAEEKAESSELQINSISREYRTLLEGKDVNMTTINFLNFQTPKLCCYYLKFKHRGQTFGFFAKKMQMEKQTVKTLIGAV